MDPLDKILSVIVLNAIVIVSEETEEDMRRFASPVLYLNKLTNISFQEESKQFHCEQVREFW